MPNLRDCYAEFAKMTCSRSECCAGLPSEVPGVPEDISVVGFDDILAAELCTPGLTTVEGPHEDAGRIAVELLLEQSSLSMQAPEPRSVVLPSNLVIRDSTGAARASSGD